MPRQVPIFNCWAFDSHKKLLLKRYSSGQSNFSEINAKLAEENEFVTHFVQKCLEMRKTVVLN